jgi:hypothetical protein
LVIFLKKILKHIFVHSTDTKKLDSFSKERQYKIHNWTHIS